MTEDIPDIFHCPLTFYHENDNYKNHLSISVYNDQMEEKYLELLSEQEKKRYDGYKYHARKKSYLLGRATAKLAIKKLSGSEPQSYDIKSGIFSQPIVEGLHKNIQVSISHTDITCVSIAYYEQFPVGIDIEKIHQPNIEVIMKILTPYEKKLVESDEINTFLLWTAKESLGKALRTGITIPLELLEIKTIEKKDGIYHIAFSNFGQYKSFSFRFKTNIISVSYPYISKADNVDLKNIEKLSKNSIS